MGSVKQAHGRMVRRPEDRRSSTRSYAYSSKLVVRQTGASGRGCVNAHTRAEPSADRVTRSDRPRRTRRAAHAPTHRIVNKIIAVRRSAQC
ncbi:hypothetical protein EVAR_66871_1 [Eumeta japonica]|uniref:Uncharacterized protein n=1 Tax=Eumeta variegata TaxID=151549 RepID=A0A4C2A079_EUMVA|nr:hypothetical protein EVAR_66871_1 [Eumeta japonica]